MRPDSTPVKIRLPPISDAAAVEIHDFLRHLLRIFENHDYGQIHRFCAHGSFANLARRAPHSRPPDNDPPF